MSGTPRTDSMRGFHGLDTAVDAEFSEQLECELNAAKKHIKRLEDAGDEMAQGCVNSSRLAYHWCKAKEANCEC